MTNFPKNNQRRTKYSNLYKLKSKSMSYGNKKQMRKLIKTVALQAVAPATHNVINQFSLLRAFSLLY